MSILLALSSIRRLSSADQVVAKIPFLYDSAFVHATGPSNHCVAVVHFGLFSAAVSDKSNFFRRLVVKTI